MSDCVLIRQVLRHVVDGYAPQGDIVDLVYNQKKLSANVFIKENDEN